MHNIVLHVVPLFYQQIFFLYASDHMQQKHIQQSVLVQIQRAFLCQLTDL